VPSLVGGGMPCTVFKDLLRGTAPQKKESGRKEKTNVTIRKRGNGEEYQKSGEGKVVKRQWVKGNLLNKTTTILLSSRRGEGQLVETKGLDFGDNPGLG